MSDANVVFMGTPELAAEVLRAILDAGYRVTGVVTQPDRAKGRKKTPVMCPVKELAVREGLRVFQPQKVRLPEAVEEVRSMEPDVIVVAAFGQILPKSLLDIPKFGCINVHASLLPEYRGATCFASPRIQRRSPDPAGDPGREEGDRRHDHAHG